MVNNLPITTSANGYQTQSQGVDTTHSLPSLTVEFVLFVLDCPYNLLSIHCLSQYFDCLITFTKDIVTLQERSSGWITC
ncbi:hypothetical protein GYH30_047800 [Glycine max]|nr:hypothetical protein GYH30_047800 [Glycine max]